MAEPDTKVNPTQDNTPNIATEADKNPVSEPANEAKGTGATAMEPKTSSVTGMASSATTAVKDNVFSMFGGGPRKEKKETTDDVDEPSGSSKAKPADV